MTVGELRAALAEHRDDSEVIFSYDGDCAWSSDIAAIEETGDPRFPCVTIRVVT